MDKKRAMTAERNGPKHIGFIMDGNGRWATDRGLPRTAGHRAGMKTLKRIVMESVRQGIGHMSVYAFSTENWKRPEEEVGFLMKLMVEVMQRELKELHEAGVRIRILGDWGALPDATRSAIAQGIELTRDNDVMELAIAFNYGGRQEILRAIRRLVEQGTPADEVDETLLSELLYTAGMPDPDLIIRTSGEMRTSNFLIWQAAYAEYYVTDTYWPDFDEQEYAAALEAFSKRERRFGGIQNEPR